MKIKSCLFLILMATSLLAKASEMICDSYAEKAALVIIDMQPYFAKRNGAFNERSNAKKLEDIDAAQIEAIKKAKAYNIPIIFIEYEASVEGLGDSNSSLKEVVRGYNRVKYLKKTTDGMFEDSNKYREDLVAYLKSNNIGTLVITGANGGACVLESIEGALEGNCNVVAYSKGIADFNFREFIYPYAGYYSKLKPKCKDCKIKEVPELDEVAEYMARGSSNGAAASKAYGGAR